MLPHSYSSDLGSSTHFLIHTNSSRPDITQIGAAFLLLSVMELPLARSKGIVKPIVLRATPAAAHLLFSATTLSGNASVRRPDLDFLFHPSATMRNDLRFHRGLSNPIGEHKLTTAHPSFPASAFFGYRSLRFQLLQSPTSDLYCHTSDFCFRISSLYPILPFLIFYATYWRAAFTTVFASQRYTAVAVRQGLFRHKAHDKLAKIFFRFFRIVPQGNNLGHLEKYSSGLCPWLILDLRQLCAAVILLFAKQRKQLAPISCKS